MRPLLCAASWVTCAFFLSIFNPSTLQLPLAEAQSKEAPKKRVKKRTLNARRCMRFEQSLNPDEVSVDLNLTSQCKFEAVCSLEWSVKCGADHSAADESNRSTTLAFGDEWNINASAETCGNEAWEIADVKWNCAPLE